jgi:hypothetical protein
MPILGIMASAISGNLFQVPGSYDSLATVSLSASASSVNFAGIPNTYKHLQIRGSAFNTSDVGLLRFNGNSTSGNYVEHGLRGDGSSASAYAQTSSRTAIQMGTAVASSGSPYTFVIDVLDYQSTSKNKTVRMLIGYDQNGSGQISLISGLFFPSTIEAINSLSITAASSVWAVNSTFSLYGVR